MVTCELCGREFKNTQGLSGHMRFFHGNESSSNTPPAPAVTEPEPSELEERLEKLEYVTGLREASILDKYLYDEKPFAAQMVEVTGQLNSITRQLGDISSNTVSNTDLHKISSRVSDLAQQLSSLSKWTRPVQTITGTKPYLEDELNSRVKNTRVNALENRVSRLEKDNSDMEAISKSILGVVGKLVDKFNTTTSQLQKQLNEQKLVTDWVKKDNNLRLIQKA